MAIKIYEDFIAEGMRHRPMTNPASSLYGKTACHKWLTTHEAWSTADAKGLHAYLKSTRAANRPASWHFSIDEKECFQGLPWGESGWHAGDNLGPGNTQSIGKEICDYAMRRSPQNSTLFWEAVTHAAKLDAYTINNVDTLLPYPDCLVFYSDVLKQHWHWSGKNCPALLRGMPDGWSKYVEMVGDFMQEKDYIELNPGDEFWVTAGSYTVVENALSKQTEVRGKNFQAELRAVTINGVVYYRVVVGIYEYNQHKEALALSNALKARAVSPTMLYIRKEPVVIEPTPIEEFPEEYDPEVDPDLDRDWIDEHPEEYDWGKDPYQEELPRGLYVILLALWEWLTEFFKHRKKD